MTHKGQLSLQTNLTPWWSSAWDLVLLLQWPGFNSRSGNSVLGLFAVCHPLSLTLFPVVSEAVLSMKKLIFFSLFVGSQFCLFFQTLLCCCFHLYVLPINYLLIDETVTEHYNIHAVCSPKTQKSELRNWFSFKCLK